MHKFFFFFYCVTLHVYILTGIIYGGREHSPRKNLQFEMTLKLLRQIKMNKILMKFNEQNDQLARR